MIEDGTPLAELREAIQKFATATAEEGVIVDIALLLYEYIVMKEDGSVARAIKYAIPTDNFGLSAGIGLTIAGQKYMMDDLFGDD
jgi:hypothetical protein